MSALPPPPPATRDEYEFSEREFYRREFRGRTLAITLPPITSTPMEK